MARLLVVDDDPMGRGLLVGTLETAGFEVVSAESGDGAIRVHGEDPVDLVIINLSMVKGDGLDTLAVLRGSADDLKIIAVSDGPFLDVAKAFGATCAFARPLDRAQLVETVNGLLGI